MTDNIEPALLEIRGWHTDRNLTVTHLLATLALAAGLLKWGMSIDSRMAVVEANAAIDRPEKMEQRINDRIDGVEVRGQQSIDQISQRLGSIESQLDTLIFHILPRNGNHDARDHTP